MCERDQQQVLRLVLTARESQTLDYFEGAPEAG